MIVLGKKNRRKSNKESQGARGQGDEGKTE